MSDDASAQLRPEIGHVLFIDIVGYSKLLINEQSELVRHLNEMVRGCSQVREADTEGKLIRLATGDGMALVFRNSPEAPAACALELSRADQAHPELELRMGIHSGPINEIADVNERANVTGAGINMAQRVMDCGDAGHILLSKRAADDLREYRHWQPLLHDLGECEVKHGVVLSLVNLYQDELGNPTQPKKLSGGGKSPKAKSARARWTLIGVVSLLLAASVFWFFLHQRRSGNEIVDTTPISKNSIAVLPFRNLSTDKDNAFFAVGIQDEILTALAKISGLKVTSRTSTEHYQSSPENLPQIARELRVAHVLEGSVQKAGDRVHINVQLIRADKDEHLWAESYDRGVADIFSVEVEVAQAVASSLQAALSPEEKVRVETKPTENPDAYVLYLRAREYQTRPTGLLQDYQTAIQLYSQAIALDPSFAVAHARLSITLAYVYLNFQPTAEIKTRALAEAEEALRLRPDLGEAREAHALCLYWTAKDYDAALRELEVARPLLPNNADIDSDTGAIRRRQGRWREAIADIERAAARDPHNSSFAREVMLTRWMVRDWPAAARAGARAVALAPDLPLLRVEKSFVDFWMRGDLRPLDAALVAVPPGLDPDGEATLARWDAALLARDLPRAEHVIATASAAEMITPFGTPLSKEYLRGCVALAGGDAARARSFFETARAGMEADAAAYPLDAFRQAQLGLLYAFLERKEDAVRQGRRAIELLPETKDAYYGSCLSGMLALIYARSGEPEQALDLIERLLILPGPVDHVFDGSITQSDLRLRWQWDPLRDNPRFQKILAGPEPKTIY